MGNRTTTVPRARNLRWRAPQEDAGGRGGHPPRQRSRPRTRGGSGRRTAERRGGAGSEEGSRGGGGGHFGGGCGVLLCGGGARQERREMPINPTTVVGLARRRWRSRGRREISLPPETGPVFFFLQLLGGLARSRWPIWRTGLALGFPGVFLTWS